MQAPVLYDITRLLTRLLNRTPNGIDRIDHAFASHVLRQSDAAGVITTPAFSSIVDRQAALEAVEGVAAHWGESEQPDDDPVLAAVLARLAGAPSAGPIRAPAPKGRGRVDVAAGVAAWVRSHGLQLSRSLARHAPEGARYVNCSQFPLWIERSFGWLGQRPDVRGVFFIHDLLPIETPEFFRPAEPERHQRRLRTVARFGAGAITTTRVVADALSAHWAGIGRSGVPIHVSPTPVAPVFAAPPRPPAGLTAPYFVLCGTIEPRKNHALILQVWRRLVLQQGEAAPRLVLVGQRGWENENAVDLLERSPALREHVIEASGMTTPGLKRLLDGACALLTPSFAEGYGLPLAEANAAGVPAIASDIPVFREIGAAGTTFVDPLDGPGWMRAVLDHAMRTGRRPTKPYDERPSGAESWRDYLLGVDAYLAKL